MAEHTERGDKLSNWPPHREQSQKIAVLARQGLQQQGSVHRQIATDAKSHEEEKSCCHRPVRAKCYCSSTDGMSVGFPCDPMREYENKLRSYPKTPHKSSVQLKASLRPITSEATPQNVEPMLSPTNVHIVVYRIFVWLTPKSTARRGKTSARP